MKLFQLVMAGTLASFSFAALAAGPDDFYGESLKVSKEAAASDSKKWQPLRREALEGEFLELGYRVVAHNDHLNDAERVARLVYRVFFGVARPDVEPFPCGGYSPESSLKIRESRNESGVITSYTLSFSGEGYVDTCTGEGGPGWAARSVSVTYDPAVLGGRIEVIDTAE